MDNKRDYYEILGVPKTATAALYEARYFQFLGYTFRYFF